jgi:2-oxo-4-hydroxy-4-carboxy-5-ureidoimidazoline decarboxylase
MSDILARWNFLPATVAANEILPCCGSSAWAHAIVARRPLPSEERLQAASDEVWWSLSELDWTEAFRSHPRIGEAPTQESGTNVASQPSTIWSQQEQQKVSDAGDSAKTALAEGNREYEHRFDRIFIVCATGKSPEEILTILRRRLENDEATELRETAEQLRQITQIRLRKWLQRSQQI